MSLLQIEAIVEGIYSGISDGLFEYVIRVREACSASFCPV